MVSPFTGLEMENYIGSRARIGVIIPSTNTAVEYDLQKINLPGVTWHPGRFFVEAPNLQSDDAFLHFLELIRQEIPVSVRDILTCEPTAIMMGMSAETFWGGIEGNEEFIKNTKNQIGDLPLFTGAEACDAALKKLGAQNITVITPYQPVGDENVDMFFKDVGYNIVNIIGLKCDTATSIAHTPRGDVFEALSTIDPTKTDAVVQVGTNLSTADIFPTFEKQLGIPVIPINVANAWYTLRGLGIQDQIDGLGILFEEH
tara:strand:+ start:11005 stop:11778 length:774 start_codon:yes stop_codon:yes gene_type:complete